MAATHSICAETLEEILLEISCTESILHGYSLQLGQDGEGAPVHLIADALHYVAKNLDRLQARLWLAAKQG